MCGICGFSGNGTIDDLRRMNDALSHRGPDAEGLWSDSSKGIYIGHKRLSIIDIAGGTQPMWTADGRIGVTFNGEIYNFRELRATLEKAGHRFLSDHSDTEVLLHGYREWGAGLPSRLNGMWAFAIYDRDRGRFFLSRDRFGKKPLYHTFRCGTFIFASELSSLRKHSLFNHSISIRSLKKYFAYNYIPAPGSLYESVYKLPAGCNLVYSIDDKEHRVERYWEFALEPFETIPKNAEAAWCEQLRELIDRAVRRRLMSDVPLGIFLSGGIDSTSVSYFAARHIEPPSLRTFSIGFEEPSFDESAYAQFAAAALGTDHHHRTLSLETAKSLLPDIAGKLDEPFGDSSLLPTYLLCKESRQSVTVALGGDGADELFAGYDPFRALRAAELYGRYFPKPLHTAIGLLIRRLPVSHVNMSLDFKLKRTLRGLSYDRKLWNPVWLGALDQRELRELFTDAIDLDDVYSEAIDCWDSCRQPGLIDKTLQFYTKLYLQNDILTKIDRASMMNSLEVRAPYLDSDLVDFVRRIPAGYKYRRGRTKYILKKALEPLLPRRILYRSKKGFGVPVGKWFMTGSLSLVNNTAPPGMNAAFIDLQIDEHLCHSADNRAFLWNMWLLERHINSTDTP
ncbi:MAG: asparagine synthase (glutamine-hydrolyzing) [Chitinispirillaceae bacterium]|nr:asparagine synthase (glutamine-hydrolyzing) [Chitinispirillaceae bacterium]